MDVDSTFITGEVVELLAAHAGSRGARHRDHRARDARRDRLRGLAARARRDARRPARSRCSPTCSPRSSRRRAPASWSPSWRRRGWPVGLVSGGFIEIVAPARRVARHHADPRQPRSRSLDGAPHGHRSAARSIDRAAKAAALREYAARVGIPMERTIAIGDGANDIDMVVAAGFGIAFNAKPLLCAGRRRRRARPARRRPRPAGLPAVTAFVPGLELARTLYDEVRPVLAERGLAHTAALVGPARTCWVSTTRRRPTTTGDRGCRCCCPSRTTPSHAADLHEELRHRLPAEIRGWTTRVAAGGVGRHPRARRRCRDRSRSTTASRSSRSTRLLRRLLGPVDPRGPMTAADWLVVPQQRLLSLTAGAVFHDDLGLEAVRERLALLPARRLAVPAGRGVDGDRSGPAPRAAGGDGRRRPRVPARHRAACAAPPCSWRSSRSAATRPTTSGSGRRSARLGSTAPLRSALAATLAAPAWADRQRALGRALVELVRRHNALRADRAAARERTVRVPQPPVRGGRRRGDRASARGDRHRPRGPRARRATARRRDRPGHRQHRPRR